jgi:hypothetical protein
MRAPPPRPAAPLALLLLALAACGGAPEGDGAVAADAPSSAAPAPATPATPAGWTGPYALRGTLESGTSVTGQLALEPLVAGAAEFDATRQRVRQNYPSYEGPFYRARMTLAGGERPLEGTFTCAHGPATPAPLVCHPTTPLPGLENATLVMQPSGRAVLTGSHGEGVSVEYGRLSWSAPAG